MGVMCTLTEDDGAKLGASEKYDAMLADLAARAEIRAGAANFESTGTASYDNRSLSEGKSQD